MYLSGDVNVMMKIQYSTMEKLEITSENERARDYSINCLGTSEIEKVKVGNDINKEEIQQIFNKAFLKVMHNSGGT